MVSVIHLPPQVSPKQLTATHRSQNLEEHLLAFLSINNKNGFVVDEGEVESADDIEALKSYIAALGDDKNIAILIQAATCDSMSLYELEGLARTMVHISEGKLIRGSALYLLCRAMGYFCYQYMLFRSGYHPETLKPLVEPPPTKANKEIRKAIMKYNKDLREKYRKQTKVINRRDPTSIDLRSLTSPQEMTNPKHA